MTGDRQPDTASKSLFLKDDRSADHLAIDLFRLDAIDPFIGIRCPLCAWRPLASSRWFCDWHGTPEPPFAACGAVWNTFATRGYCPGCSHLWHWTSCLRCHQVSPHHDWYECDAEAPH